VAQPGFKEDVSEYYPPRARWHTRLLFESWRHVRRLLHLEKLHLPGRLSPIGWVLSLALPAFSFFALGRRLLGGLFLAAYGVAAAVFIIRLGYPAANLAFGVLIFVHATSIIFLESLWLHNSEFRNRLILALLTLFAVWGLVYFPLTNFAERHWIVPLRIRDRVMIVRCGFPSNLQRGDWVAHRISGDRYIGEREDRVYLGTGLSIDPVLALPGDHIQFSNQVFFVNDQPFPAAAHMPSAGDVTVPEKVWFIWPNLDITRRGVPESSVTATMEQAAMVKQDQIIGRSFRSWFGRRQWP
jgi:hypothetical protein